VVSDLEDHVGVLDGTEPGVAELFLAAASDGGDTPRAAGDVAGLRVKVA
jgi:hypothetical protein